MKKQTMGEIIGALRKEKGMTQKDLADKMGVTDKAVSKWERNLSCPDISSLPMLAEVLGTSVETLMDVKSQENEKTESVSEIVDLILKAVPLAMGVAVPALAMLGQLELKDGLSLLGIGLACLAVRQFKEK